MGNWKAEFQTDKLLGMSPVSRGVGLDSAILVRELAEAFPGFHADLGGRKGIWHPEQSTLQGLHYLHKHVCSMDRGTMPQWPEWNTVEELVEVPIDYALRHEDFPVLSLNERGEAEMCEADTAMIMARRLDSVKKVGWAEVFWRLKQLEVDGLTPTWLGTTFRLPMDWMGQLKVSPVAAIWNEAHLRGLA